MPSTKKILPVLHRVTTQSKKASMKFIVEAFSSANKIGVCQGVFVSLLGVTLAPAHQSKFQCEYNFYTYCECNGTTCECSQHSLEIIHIDWTNKTSLFVTYKVCNNCSGRSKVGPGRA